MSVPPSSLTLNIGDPTDSTEAGWANTGFTALPFNSDLEIQALDLWLALRTAASVQLLVEGSTVGDAGVYVDVPRLDAKVTPVSDVDVNCNPITSSTDNADDDRNILTSPIKVDVSGSYDYGAYTRVSAAYVVLKVLPSLIACRGLSCQICRTSRSRIRFLFSRCA